VRLILLAIRALTRRQKIVIAVAADSIATLAVGMALSNFLSSTPYSLVSAVSASFVAAAAALVVIVLLGGYATIIRFMPSSSSFVYAMGSLVGAVTWLFVMERFSSVSSFAGVLYFTLVFGLTFGSRFALRELNNRFANQNTEVVPVAIYGAGSAGRQLAAYISSDAHYRPVAFLDDNLALQGLKVAGLRVYPPKYVATLLQSARVKEVLLALPNVGQKRRSEILFSLSENSIRVRTIPSLAEILSGKARIEDLRPIKVEDVLGRDPVAPEYPLMRRNLHNRSVLVTGAGGSIGSELCRSILQQMPRTLVLLDLSEHALFQVERELRAKLESAGDRTTKLISILGSVENLGLLRHLLQAHAVNTIFHAAAYKHVPLVEANVIEGVTNNVLGTRVLLEAIHGSDVSTFVMISTDKAVRPTSVMGASKRAAELLVQAAAHEGSCDMAIVRFGNVLGSSGSVLPMFQAQIAAGGPITVTHRDVTRFFMTIPEAAQLVIQAGAMGERGDVFHLDMGQPIRILDLARRLLRLHGLRERTVEQEGDVEIKIVGLRPGEKLYEELLIDSDAKPTLHPRIYQAREKYIPRDQLTPLINQLLLACHVRDEVAVIALLGELVEGYVGPATEKRALRPAGESRVVSPARQSKAEPSVVPFRSKSVQ
jgi:FlaA1/EpsC-like NDP-sugar epimerase